MPSSSLAARTTYALAVLVAISSLSVEAFSPHSLTTKVTTAPSVGFVSKRRSVLSAIVDEVTDEMKTAMKAKDKVTLGTCRLVRSAFQNAEIANGGTVLSDEEAQNVLRKLSKMRNESIEMYSSGGRDDLADAERAELAIIERWLPSLAGEEQTRIWVKEAIEKVGADNFGKIMGALMKDHRAEMDGNLAKKLVNEELA